MASQVQNPASNSANTAAEERSQKVQQYVNRQLEKTRRQVKMFDLVTGVVGLTAFVICFFLLAAIVDAWVWPLGTLGRFLGLAILVVGVFGYFGFFILPLFLRRINPDYAARMIEESKPTFKNSLLNYLSLRKQPEKTRRAVYDAVARQAARDLSEVPEDSTVDRSNLIHVGFILVGISIAAVLYLVLSPKSPLPTIGRILSPVAKIAQPSIVKIVDVNPGDAKVFFGENLEVTASVRGRHDASDVKIIFSTDDGELLDQSIPMVANESLNRYQTKLTTDGFGIQQPLHYRVVAGDGSSPKYQIIVRPNPTISIQSAIITPPGYTKLPERTIDGQGDLQALEGSRIRLNAVANLPIQIAYIELLNSNGERSDEYRVTQTIEMSSEGQAAVGDFLAVLNTKRDKQLFTHFRVRFVSVDDDQNENPNVYPIRITPDLAPEVVIVNPIRNVIALPINQQLAVDIQATDLDFEISSVDLHLDHQGTRLLDRDLKFKTVVGNQRVTSRQIIDPTAFNFKVGDKAIFFATAADNRTSPYGNQLDPNISRTENYTLVITSPREQITEPEQQEPEEQTPQDQEQKGEPDDDQNADNQQQTGENSDEQQQPGDKNENQGQENGSQKEPGGGDSKQTGGDSQESSGNEGKGEQAESSEGQNPDKSDQTDEQSENNSGGDNSKSGDQKQTSNEGDGAETENGSQGKSQAANNSNEGQNGEGTSENVDNSQPGESGSRGSAGDEQDQQEGARDDSLSDGNQEPLPDDATLGDQFERLQELLNDKSQEDEAQEGEGQQGDKSQGDKSQEGEAQEGEAQEGENQDDQAQKGESQAQQGSGQEGKENQAGQQGTSQEGKADQAGQQGSGQEGKEDQAGQQGSGQEGKEDQAGQQGSGQEGKEDQAGQQGSGQEGKEDQAGQQGSGQEGKEDQAGQQGSGQEGKEDQAGQQGSGQEGKEDQAGQQGSGQEGKEDQAGQQGSGQEGKEDQAGQQGTSQEGKEDRAGQQGTSQEGKEDQAGQQGSAKEGKEGQAGQSGAGQEPGQGQPSDQKGEPGDAGQQEAGTNPQASDQATGSPGGQGADGNADLGDEQANLQYTKKATDLVLDKLESQQNDPDPELLKKMNWTKEDMQEFIQRWREMQEKAKSGNEVDRKRYENALRSLGLLPAQGSRQLQRERDDMTGLSEDGAVNQPPSHLIDAFNAFQRERNRVKDRRP